MRRWSFTEEQIIGVLREQEGGIVSLDVVEEPDFPRGFTSVSGGCLSVPPRSTDPRDP